jgi:hypothetical protein
MHNCTCTKCGVSAMSKNPATRSVFLRDQELADREAVMPSFIEKRENAHGQTIVIQYPAWQAEPLTKEELENRIKHLAYTMLNMVDDGKIAQFFCEHEFVADHPEEITVW